MALLLVGGGGMPADSAGVWDRIVFGIELRVWVGIVRRDGFEWSNLLGVKEQSAADGDSCRIAERRAQKLILC